MEKYWYLKNFKPPLNPNLFSTLVYEPNEVHAPYMTNFISLINFKEIGIFDQNSWKFMYEFQINVVIQKLDIMKKMRFLKWERGANEKDPFFIKKYIMYYFYMLGDTVSIILC